MEHLIYPDLLTRRVKVHLIGVGGNGAQMAACLARLDIAVRALGHPYGLHVAAYDGDAVGESNIGRQMFFPVDVGQNKASVMVQRLNLSFGIDWIARPWNYRAEDLQAGRPDIVISCVDTRSTRRKLHSLVFKAGSGVTYWLDLGNTEEMGQVVLGVPPSARLRPNEHRLPCVTELYPELLDASIADDNAPSCSVRISLANQGLFVNDVVVRFGAQLLYELFQGRLTEHGVVLNVRNKRVAPIQIDPAVWERFGHRPGAAAPASPRRRRQSQALGQNAQPRQAA